MELIMIYKTDHRINDIYLQLFQKYFAYTSKICYKPGTAGRISWWCNLLIAFRSNKYKIYRHFCEPANSLTNSPRTLRLRPLPSLLLCSLLVMALLVLCYHSSTLAGALNYHFTCSYLTLDTAERRVH